VGVNGKTFYIERSTIKMLFFAILSVFVAYVWIIVYHIAVLFGLVAYSPLLLFSTAAILFLDLYLSRTIRTKVLGYEN